MGKQESATDFLILVLFFSPLKIFTYLAVLDLSCGTWDRSSLWNHTGSLAVA